MGVLFFRYCVEFIAGRCLSHVFVLWWGKYSTGACLRVRLANKAVVGELLKLRFLKLVEATTYVIIGGGCANPQSPHFER